MRRALSVKASPGSPVSSAESIPAPVGGWNDRDALSNMPPTDAVKMINWFPETSEVRVRKGYTKHFTGLYQAVESLMVYNANDGTQQMFAASGDGQGSGDGAFYEVTTKGDISSLVGDRVVGSLDTIRWGHENFTNSSGTSYLICYAPSGAQLRYWDGSSWTTVSGAGSPSIDTSNVSISVSQFTGAFAHKRRMFFLGKDTLDLMYLPIDSVGGVLNSIPLGGLATKGGYLVQGATWTLDAGEGPDDYLAVVTSEGQVIVYSGTNPASDYSLVGVWNLARPIGDKPLIKYRGDLLYLCRDGLWPLSKALIASKADQESALTFKISRTITSSGNSYNQNYGWQPLFFPEANMVLVNVPVQEGFYQEQYVMNTITGAWGRFTDVFANCWAVMNGEAYFGSTGFVGKFWDTFADDGDPIESDMWQAFTYLGSRGQIKQVKSMRPNIVSNSSPSFFAGVNVDFVEGSTNLISAPSSDFGVWDSSNWDESLWSDAVTYYGEWVGASGVGTAIGPRLKTSTNTEIKYQSMDLLFESGTVIG